MPNLLHSSKRLRSCYKIIVSPLALCTTLEEISEEEEAKGAFKLAMTECKEMVGFGEIRQGEGGREIVGILSGATRQPHSPALPFSFHKRIFSIWKLLCAIISRLY